MSADYFDKQGNDTFYNQGVTFRLEHHFAVFHIGLQPYSALATVYQVLFCFIFGGEWFLLVTQIYEQLILVHPVIKITELFYHFVLKFVYCFHYFIIYFSL